MNLLVIKTISITYLFVLFLLNSHSYRMKIKRESLRKNYFHYMLQKIQRFKVKLSGYYVLVLLLKSLYFIFITISNVIYKNPENEILLKNK